MATRSLRFAATLPAFSLALALGFIAAPTLALEASAGAEAANQRTYGESLSLSEVTSIDQILAAPKTFEGKSVRIEGEVGDVCPRKGCWMDVTTTAPNGETKSLRVKVADDVIVFPSDARGTKVVAEGVVQVLDLSREQYVGWLAHEAEERGETFDPESVGEGPFQRIQLDGIGAELRAP